jgi:hypothetical protein
VAAVVAFYAAVHLIERLAAVEPSGPVHNPNHAMRESWLSAHRIHRRIFLHYMPLKRAGEIARYGTINQFEREFDSSTVQSILIDTHLAAIEAHVASATAPPPPPAT